MHTCRGVWQPGVNAVTHVVGDDQVVKPAMVAAHLEMEELDRLHTVLARRACQTGAGGLCNVSAFSRFSVALRPQKP